MGILPLKFLDNENFESLNLNAKSTFTIGMIDPNTDTVKVKTSIDNIEKEFTTKVRIDSPMEWEYYKNEGILNYVLNKIVN